MAYLNKQGLQKVWSKVLARISQETSARNTAIEAVKALTVTASLSAQTFNNTTIITNSKVTSTMVVVNSVLSDDSVQKSDWTIATGAGTVKLTGKCTGAATLTLVLLEARS